MESFNLDRSSRCFRRGGGCVISGNEWVYIFPHNAALRIVSGLFGYPSRSYGGPYPTKEEGLDLTAKAPATPLAGFVSGKLAVDGEVVEFDVNMVKRLVDRLGLCWLENPEEGDLHTEVRAVLYQKRCVVVRLSEQAGVPDSGGDWHKDILIFFDKRVKRPFAYFNIDRHSMSHLQPVAYLPEQDR